MKKPAEKKPVISKKKATEKLKIDSIVNEVLNAPDEEVVIDPPRNDNPVERHEVVEEDTLESPPVKEKVGILDSAEIMEDKPVLAKDDDRESQAESAPKHNSDSEYELVQEEPVSEERSSFYERVTGERSGAYSGDNNDSNNSNKKLFLLGFVCFVLTVAITSAVGIYLLNATQNGVTKEEPTAAITPTVTPEPTEEPLARDEWTIEVLNGSGVTGEAGRVADTLRELGYDVVGTGNADATDETEVYVVEDKEDEVEPVLKDLESELGKLTVTGPLEDSDAQIRIVLGATE